MTPADLLTAALGIGTGCVLVGLVVWLMVSAWYDRKRWRASDKDGDQIKREVDAYHDTVERWRRWQ